jgi:hypothetical protein
MAAKLYCVFSTLANAQRYTLFRKPADKNMQAPEEVAVLVKGGAGLADKNFQTARGVPTLLTQAEWEALQRMKADPHHIINVHIKGGHIVLEELSAPPSDATVEKRVADMNGRDNSAPLVEQDFSGKPGDKAPTIGAVETVTDPA